MRAGSLTVVPLLVVLGGDAAAQQQPPIRPSSPAVVAVPAWSRVMIMGDGRTFVSDGGLLIDAALAKPASLPATVIPRESVKRFDDSLSAPYEIEVGLGELRPGPLENTFVTPSGMGFNGNYITFLRRVATVGRTRIRLRGPLDPAVVVVGGQPVALMMPLAMPAR